MQQHTTSEVVSTPIYVNMGNVRLVDNECWLLLGTEIPGVTKELSLALVLPLQFAGILVAKLQTAVQGYINEVCGPSEAATEAALVLPFQPCVLRPVNDPEVVPARLPGDVLAEYGDSIMAWRHMHMSLSAIAARLGVSKTTIWNFLDQQGQTTRHPRRGSKLDPFQHDIWAMRRARRSYSAIAAMYQCTHNTVWSWCQTHPDPQAQAMCLEDQRRASAR